MKYSQSRMRTFYTDTVQNLEKKKRLWKYENKHLKKVEQFNTQNIVSMTRLLVSIMKHKITILHLKNSDKNYQNC